MARDPQRIEPLLTLLRAAWERAPGLRLGQLIEIATSHAGNDVDAFYIEDEDLTRGLEYLRDSIDAQQAARSQQE